VAGAFEHPSVFAHEFRGTLTYADGVWTSGSDSMSSALCLRRALVLLCVSAASLYPLAAPTAARAAALPDLAGGSRTLSLASTTVAWPGNPFSPSSVWNRELGAHERLASDSRRLTDDLVNEVSASHGGWINTWDYSDPVYVVAGDQRDVRVTLDVQNPALQKAFAAVPIPAGARAALGTDEHMSVWQPSTNRMWDFWHMRQVGGIWHARWGGEMTDVSQNPGYFQNRGSDLNWGATATGLPLLGGLITYADLQQGYIDHAVSLALPETESQRWVWPAQRTDGATWGINGAAIPEGTHFELNPALDLATLHLSPVALMIARAAQRYGAVAFFGQAPTTSSDPWTAAFEGKYPNQVLEGFPWSHLEVVQGTESCCWAPK
jgi:hypothetical protein